MTISDIIQIPLSFKPLGSCRCRHRSLMPLWSLVKGIRENAKLAETTAAGRRILAEQGKDAFKDWKPEHLMSVYFAPKFKDGEGKNQMRANTENLVGYTGLAGFDFDGVDAPAVLAALRAVPQVVCAGISASGSGVWCAAHVAAATAQEYALCFADGIRAFREAGLPGLDIGAHDPTRARFAASCPECWWRWEAEGEVPAFLPIGDLGLLGKEKKQRGFGKGKLPEGYVLTPELAFDEARQIIAEIKDVQVGERDTTMASMCGRMKAAARRAGVNPAAYVGPFIAEWDAKGYPHKKTLSQVNRLLLGKD